VRRELDALRSLQRYVGMALPAPWDVRIALEAGPMPQRPYALVTANAAASSSGRRDVYDLTLPYTVHLYPAPAETRAASIEQELELREVLLNLVEVGIDPGTHRRLPLWSYLPREAIQRIKVTAGGGTWRTRQPGATLEDLPGPWTDEIAYNATAGDVQAALEAAGLAVAVIRRGSRLHDVHFLTVGVDEPLLEGDGSLLLASSASRPAALEVEHVLHGAEAPWRSDRDFMRLDADPQLNTVRDAADPRMMMVALDLRCTFGRSQPIPSDSTLLQSYRLRFKGMA
jgi:hypothetical protein